MTPVSLPPLLCDTGVLSRLFARNEPFVEAYQTALQSYRPVLSTAVYIELQDWLVQVRGASKNSISRSDYDRYRHLLNQYVVLNSDGVSDQAMNVAERWPDTPAWVIATT